MTSRITDTNSIKDFIEIGNKFCKIIEDRDNFTSIQLLQEIYRIIPKLCICGTNLPDVNQANLYKLKISNKKYFKIEKSLEKKFKKYNRYNEIYDNYNFHDIDPVQGSLSDDLTDIYCDINPGLRNWHRSSAKLRRDIVFSWKLDFEIHWGEHLTSVLRALYCLLYTHLEDEYDMRIGIRNVKKVKFT
jgi:hypothetical protein